MSTQKAVVVGGSNGVGLAIASELIKQHYHVIIVDKCKPTAELNTEQYEFLQCDLCNFNYEAFEKLSKDENVNFLMITAGFGRVADFENIHPVEIEKIIKVNTIASLQIIRSFYDRIKSEKEFFVGVMGSIAGLVSSPMFSVYAASKAAICKFVESVNIELESYGTTNRILNVSPGSIKGTRFNGGENDLSALVDLSSEIIQRIKQKETLFIPNGAVYMDVLERYKENPHKFGIESYQYKQQSGRVKNEKTVKIGYLSGTFDLFHIGHLNLLRRAKAQCDYLIVGVHPDASHKGKETFISFEERVEIVGACKYVDKVVESCKEDSDAWILHRFDKLFVGSDYKGSERFKKYEQFFADKGVEIVYFPYTQGTSSTQIRDYISKKIDQ